jgi:hypothetical protein
MDARSSAFPPVTSTSILRCYRQSRLQGWQFGHVRTIQILIAAVVVERLPEVDWVYWMDSAKRLETDHDDRAELSPEELDISEGTRGSGAASTGKDGSPRPAGSLASEIAGAGAYHRAVMNNGLR